MAEPPLIAVCYLDFAVMYYMQSQMMSRVRGLSEMAGRVNATILSRLRPAAGVFHRHHLLPDVASGHHYNVYM